MGKIAVIGSCSTDFTVTTDKLAHIGETVLGQDLHTAFGGKGANQAIAAARLTSPVKMIACVGEDHFGQEIINNFTNNQVDVTDLRQVSGPSGTAHITLYQGDNSIIVVPSANNKMTFSSTEEIAAVLKGVDLVLLQHEIPLATNEAVINYCYNQGITTILNPAPAAEISTDLLNKVSYLTPNEHEVQILLDNKNWQDQLSAYPNKVIVTLGEEGAVFHNGKDLHYISAYPSQVVDSTGAGDTFNGAFAHALMIGLKLEEAIKLANLAASLSIQAVGAQGGIPSQEELMQSPHYEQKWKRE